MSFPLCESVLLIISNLLFPVFSYKVDVYTGKEPGADTEASVYVQLIGARGDSGKRLLYKSLNNDMKFQEGQMDTFEVEAVSLKEIKQVVIGHDGHGKGQYKVKLCHTVYPCSFEHLRILRICSYNEGIQIVRPNNIE